MFFSHKIQTQYPGSVVPLAMFMMMVEMMLMMVMMMIMMIFRRRILDYRDCPSSDPVCSENGYCQCKDYKVAFVMVILVILMMMACVMMMACRQ